MNTPVSNAKKAAKKAEKKETTVTATPVSKKNESSTTFMEDKEKLAAQNNPAPAVDAVAPQAESIGLEDLKQIIAIVDIASQRGAFRGPELEQVGAVYNKVSRFLKYVDQAQKQAQAKQK